MMIVKFYLKLLIIANVFQKFDFQSVATDNQCTAEEVSAIIRENSDLIEEKIQKSVLVIQQQLKDAKNEISQSSEPLQLQEVSNQVKARLDQLKQNVCTRSVEVQFKYKTLKLEALQNKCLTNAKKKENFLQEKTESSLKKAQTMKAKVSLAFQKCAFESWSDGCSSVKTCCQQVLVQAKNKIKAKATKIGNSILKVVSEHNSCFSKAAKEGVDIESDIQEELLECRLQGFQSDTQSGSGESSVSNESKYDQFVKIQDTTVLPKEETRGSTEAVVDEKFQQQTQSEVYVEKASSQPVTESSLTNKPTEANVKNEENNINKAVDIELSKTKDHGN